ncbi:hypothetical protein AMTRI_Chr01g131210 [Amborella trichopoda]
MYQSFNFPFNCLGDMIFQDNDFFQFRFISLYLLCLCIFTCCLFLPIFSFYSFSNCVSILNYGEYERGIRNFNLMILLHRIVHLSLSQCLRVEAFRSDLWKLRNNFGRLYSTNFATVLCGHPNHS